MGKPDHILVRGPDLALAMSDHVATVYFIPGLRKVRIDIRDPKSGKIDIVDFARKALRWLADNWGDHWGSALAPALLLTHIKQTAGNFPSGEEATLGWEQGLAFGVLLERLRSKYELTITTETFDLTPEEMAEELGDAGD